MGPETSQEGSDTLEGLAAFDLPLLAERPSCAPPTAFRPAATSLPRGPRNRYVTSWRRRLRSRGSLAIEVSIVASRGPRNRIVAWEGGSQRRISPRTLTRTPMKAITTE